MDNPVQFNPFTPVRVVIAVSVIICTLIVYPIEGILKGKLHAKIVGVLLAVACLVAMIVGLVKYATLKQSPAWNPIIAAITALCIIGPLLVVSYFLGKRHERYKNTKVMQVLTAELNALAPFRHFVSEATRLSGDRD